MNLQPTLKDKLVLIRPLVEEDFAALYAVASDPLIWEQHPANDRYQLTVFQRFFADALASGTAFTVIDQADGRVIGSTRYRISEGVAATIEIGWTFLARSHWGGVYNEAMKVLLIEHAFPHFEQVALLIGLDNVRSWRAAEKLGAVQLPTEAAAPLVIGKENYGAWVFRRTIWRRP